MPAESEVMVEGVPLRLWDDIVSILEAIDSGFHIPSDVVARVMDELRSLDQE